MHTENYQNYLETREFSDNTINPVIDQLFYITGEYFKQANFKQDTKHGYDLVSEDTGTTVAVRIRNKYYSKYYGQITIRSNVVYGGITEAAKMSNGIMADRIFYGFSCNDHLLLWVYLDMKRLWKDLDETFEGLPVHYNADGTAFYTIDWRYYPNAVLNTDIKYTPKKFN